MILTLAGGLWKPLVYTVYVENYILQGSYKHDTKYTGRELVLIKSQTYRLASWTFNISKMICWSVIISSYSQLHFKVLSPTIQSF